MAKTGC